MTCVRRGAVSGGAGERGVYGGARVWGGRYMECVEVVWKVLEDVSEGGD